MTPPTPENPALAALEDLTYVHTRNKKANYIYRLKDETFDTIRQALQSPACGWQDISTAPRDGTRVLVTACDEQEGQPEIYPYIAVFNVEQDAWKSDDNYWIDFDHLTHWKPLDVPPKGPTQ